MILPTKILYKNQLEIMYSEKTSLINKLFSSDCEISCKSGDGVIFKKLKNNNIVKLFFLNKEAFYDFRDRWVYYKRKSFFEANCVESGFFSSFYTRFINIVTMIFHKDERRGFFIRVKDYLKEPVFSFPNEEKFLEFEKMNEELYKEYIKEELKIN